MDDDRSRDVIVVGVDDSSESVNAMRYALRLAQAYGCNVRVVHAYGPTVYQPHDTQRLSRTRSAAYALVDDVIDQVQVPDEVRVDQRVEPGPRGRALIRAAAGAFAVVVGHHVGGWGGRALSCSVASIVSARSERPVVTVPGSWSPATGDNGPVMAALDGEDPADATLAFAFGHASALGVPVVVLHAVPMGEHADDNVRRRVAVRTTITDWTRRFPDVEVTSHFVHRDAGEALADASLGASLLVVGRSSDAPFFGGWVRSVGRAVLRQTACPLVVVPRDFAGLHGPFRVPLGGHRELVRNGRGDERT